MLNQEISAGLADPKISVRIGELGGETLSGSSKNFGKLIASETEKWDRGRKVRGDKIRMIRFGGRPMSALGHKQTFQQAKLMSA